MRFERAVVLVLAVAAVVAGPVALAPLSGSAGANDAVERVTADQSLDTASNSVVLPMIARDGGPGDAVLNNPDPYAVGTRTGIAEVDGVLAALEAESHDALEALFTLTPAPCVINPQGITNPPLCTEGVRAGTLVPVFRATSCESVWPAYLDELLTGQVWSRPHPVLAIYRDPTDAYSWLPAADFAILVLQGGPPNNGRPAVIRVSGGRVSGIAFGCGHTFAQLVAGVDTGRFVLAPRW